MGNARPTIVVVGSINMDLAARVATLPRPGETVIAQRFEFSPGGKGANQAVAAARLGARTLMVGRVGDDAFGPTLKRELGAAGVETRHVGTVTGCPSGLAWISLDDAGANSIIVVPGANAALSPADIEPLHDIFDAADMVLMQLEIPQETAVAALRLARSVGVQVVLDAAPAPTLGLHPELFGVDILSPNQIEAEALTGIPVRDASSAERAARSLIERGARNVVLKLGDQGAMILSPHGSPEIVPTPRVDVLDTTAAGDAFTAALACELVQWRHLPRAVRFACAAGALACTRRGAQAAMPDRAAVLELLACTGDQWWL